MAEELQSLLERIRTDGVQKADEEAGKIISDARAKADAMVKDAEHSAKTLVARAEQDAAQFMERSRKTLEQAARDVVLSVGDAVTAAMNGIAAKQVTEALNADTLRNVLVTVIKAYCGEQKNDRIDVLLSPADQKAVSEFLLAGFQEEMKKGLKIQADSGISAGFKVSLVDKNVQHDFSVEAITEALSQLVRPQLAEILRNAQKNGDN